MSSEHMEAQINKMQKSLADCVNQIASSYFPHGMIIYSVSVNINGNSIINTVEIDSTVLKYLHLQLDWQVLTKYTALSHAKWDVHLERTFAYILLIETHEDFLKNLDVLKNLPTWNPSAYIVILLMNLETSSTKLVIQLIETLWSLYALNTLIFVPDKNDNAILQVVSWFPYANGSCGDDFHRYTQINTCKHGKFIYEKDMFPEKSPRNMNNCIIKVVAIIWPPFVIAPPDYEIKDNVDIPLQNGYEILMLQVLEKYYNIKFVYRSFSIPENWGRVTKNGTCTGMFKYLSNKSADIAIGGNFAEAYVHRYFDHSLDYLQDSQVFVFPQAGLAPGWKNFGTILTPIVLCSFVVVVILTSVVFYLLAKNSQKRLLFKSFFGALMNIFSMTMNNFMGTFPKKVALRMLLMFLFCFNINYVAIFQTGLISTFSFPLKNY